ncbi:PH domain protein (macronuclear) [Tetrahymena thermophila SB210]|uniref:PH domain protein n=1 Tax=Tetrahymena thermophila (strain SB210) TaxID=312017 RepID=I7LW97_TETTS|nr:PH domain protein [Tetrahymena thermophila SB210]EAS01215.2 PH domain protein [Tetrahymena thermophila SB210]|eukprot:XP_001021460.2 PH domain protein [Tetrahymena thermophila SB210]
MLGNIIEKILKSYLGQYLDGIERKYIHVGMFSGKFKVENVRIKQELIDLLEWPIKLQFSFVETFEVNFQITNFRSKPFRIEMSNIFMMVQPKEKSEWNLHTFNTLAYKQNWLEYYIQQFIQEQAKQEQAKQLKQGEATGMSGYIERLAAVVVDNIEICIKNVHLRFESQNPVYAWGITIGKIEAFTVNNEWKEKTFVDRMNAKDRDKPINKLVQIKNFGFYWENSQAEMFANQNQDVIVEKMYEYVIYQAQAGAFDYKRGFSSTQYIVCFSVDLRLIMNFVVQKWDIPEFDMKISFNNIDIKISHEQLKDMLMLSTLLSNYQYCMRIEKDKVKIKTSKPDIEHFKRVTSSIRQIKAEISSISSLLDGFNRANLIDLNNQYTLNLDLVNNQVEQINQNEQYKLMDRNQLKSQLDQKQEKLQLLKQELNMLRNQYWRFCFDKVQQFLMEKYYKESLKKIMSSKIPTVQKLVKEKDFQKIYQYKILDQKQVKWYKKAIQKNDLEDLVRWSKIENIGQKSTEKSKKEKQKSSRGLFGFSKQVESEEEEEKNFNLARKFDKAKYQEAIDQAFPIRNANVRPKEYVWMQIEVKIQSCTIQISELIEIEQGKHPKYHDRNSKIKQIEEGLLTQYYDIRFEMLKRDINFEISTELRDLQMCLFTQQQDSRNQVLVPILKKVETISQDKKPLVYFRFEKQPINKPNTFFVLNSEIQQIIFTYYPQKLQRIISWLDYQTQFVSQSQQHHEIQSNQEEYDLSMLKKEQNIVMRAPIIVIPLNSQSSNESECLVINFQELKFQSIDEQIRNKNSIFANNSNVANNNSGNNIINSPNSKNYAFSKASPNQNPLIHSPSLGPNNLLERQHSKTIIDNPLKKNTINNSQKSNKLDPGVEIFYEYYKVEATGITISYFSSINHLNNHLRFKNSTKYNEIVNNPIRKKGVIHDIVEKFNYSMELGLLNQYFKGLFPQMPNTTMKSEISNITLNLTSYLYFTLNKISDLFKMEDDITKVQEFLQLDKEILIKFSQEKGYLMKRGDTFKSWANYYVIFSGNFLYFFNNRNDDYYTYHIYFKNAIIKAESSLDIGVPFCIKLIVKNKEIYLAANNSQEYRKWMRVLTKYQGIINQEKEKKKKLQRDKLDFESDQFPNNQNTQNQQENSNQIQNKLEIKLNIQKFNIQIHQDFKKQSSLIAKNHQENDTSQWMDINIDLINLDFTSKTSETNLKIKLGSLKAIDFIHLYPQGFIESLIQSYPFIEDKNKKFQKNLMEFEFTQRNSKHPSFNNIEMDIKASIGSLFLNWKPDTFKRILQFFNSQQQEEQNYQKDRKEQSVQQNQQKTHQSYAYKDIQSFDNHNDIQESKYKQSMMNKPKNVVTNSRLASTQKSVKSKFNTNTIEEEEQTISGSYAGGSKAQIILPEENKNKQSMKININTQFEELQVILIHRTSDIKNNDGLHQFTALARIDIIQGNLQGRFYPQEKYLDANLGDLQVIDLTRYPDTQIIYNQFSIEGLKIFGRDDNVAGDVIKIQFVSYDDGQNGIENKYTLENIYSVIDIKINQLYLVYFQKPFLRLVNYWQQQLIAVLTNKYNTDSELEENKNNSKDLLSQLRNPKFINYMITIDKPKIVLKSTPQTNEWIELNLGSITIQNSNYQKKIKELENDRKINFMWCEKIQIECSEMSVFMKYSTQEIRVSDNIHFNLEIETYPFFTYYSQYFKNKTDLTNQIEILGRSTLINLKISKHQYQTIMNILNQNLNFDDGYDKYFIFNYEVRKQQSSKVQTYIQLDFSEISLYLQDQNSKKDVNEGLISFYFQETGNQENCNSFKLSIQDAKFIYISEVSDYFEIEFHGKHLFGSYFLNKNEIFLGDPVQEDTQIGFLGDLGPIKQNGKPTDEKKKKNLREETRRGTTSSMRNMMKSSFVSRQSISNNVDLNYSEEQTIQEYLQQVKASVSMIFYKEGSTKMRITLANSKLLINSYVIFSILNFIKTDEIQEQSKSASKQKKKNKQPAPFTIDLKTKNILIGVQSDPKEKQIIVLSGTVKVLYEKDTLNTNHIDYHNEQEGVEDREEDESIAHLSNYQMEQLQNTSLKISAKKLEVSNIQVKDLYEKSSQIQLKKRNIMKPTEFRLIHSQFSCDCQEEVKLIQNTKFFIGKANCHLSYKDLDLLYTTLKFQKALKENAKQYLGYFDNLVNNKDNESEIISIGSIAQKVNNTFQPQPQIITSEMVDSNNRSYQVDDAQLSLAAAAKRTNFTKKQTIFMEKLNDNKLQPINQNSSQIIKSQKINSNNIISGASIVNVNRTFNQNGQSKKQTSGENSQLSKSQLSKKNDKPIQNFRLIVESVEVLIINDLNQSFIPMMHLNFQLFPEILYTLENGLGKVEGVCIFEIEYFNPSVGKMEPIIEEASFKMMYIFNEEKNQKILDIEQNQNDKFGIKPLINMNISDRMIAVLYKSFKYWRKRFQQNSQKINMDNHQAEIPFNFEQSMINSLAINPSNFFHRQQTKFITSSAENHQQKEYVTLFSFYNMTGYTIIVKKLQQDQKAQTIRIESGQTLNFQIESDQENFAKTFESHYSVMVQFETRGYQTFYIYDIKSDRERQDVYLWQQKRIQDENFGDISYLEEKQKEEIENNKIIQQNFNKQYIDNYTFKKYQHHFFLSQIELVDVRKTIILSSCYVIQNFLQFKVKVKLENKNVGSFSFEIKPKKIGAIPLEFMDELTYISIQGNPKNNQSISEYSRPQSLIELYQLGFNQSKEIYHHPMVCLVRKQYDTVMKDRVILVFDTLITFQNLLPLPLNISIQYLKTEQSRITQIENARRMFDQEQHRYSTGDQINLLPQQLYQENYASYSSQIDIKAWVVGFFKSQSFLVYQRGAKENTYPRQLIIKDSKEKEQIINIEREFDGGSVRIKFYCKMCIINTTGLDLIVYRVDGQKYDIIQGQQNEMLKLEESNNSNHYFANVDQSSQHSEQSFLSNKLKKQKSLFENYQIEQESIQEDQVNEDSMIHQHSKYDQFFHRVILLNETDEKLALSFKQIEFIQKKTEKNIDENLFIQFSVKSINIKEQDFIDLKIMTPDQANYQSQQNLNQNQKQVFQYDLALKFNQHKLNNTSLYTKILTIIPKIVIVNKSTINFQIKQFGTESTYILPTKKRIIQKWEHNAKQTLQIRPNDKYEWSGEIAVEFIKTYHFYCHKKIDSQSETEKNYDDYIFMNASVEQGGPITYVMIRDVQEDNIPYLFINNCSEILIKIKQLNKEAVPQTSKQNLSQPKLSHFSNSQIKKSTYLPFDKKKNQFNKFIIYPNKNTNFAWQNPCQESKVQVKFYLFNKDEKLKVQPIIIDLQSINFEDHIVCELVYGNRIMRIQQNTSFKGMTRIITFSEFFGNFTNPKNKSINIMPFTQSVIQSIDQNQSMLNSQDEINSMDQIGEGGFSLNLKIREIGVSFIANHGGKNKELNYILFKNIETSFIQNKDIRDISLNIKYFQIDNNTDQDSITPINVTPQLYRSIMENDENKVFCFKMKQNHQAQAISIIQNFELNIAPLKFKIDQEYLQTIIDVNNNISRIIEEMIDDEEDEFNVKYTITKYLFEQQKKRSLMEKDILKKEEFDQHASFFEDWRFHDLPEVSSGIYIKNLQIGKILVGLSYHPSFISEPDSYLLLNTFASVLGTAIGNVDDAPLKIKKYIMKEVYDSQSGIKNQILKNYKSQAFRQLFRILGSFEIIGNPVGFYNKIVDGFQELVEKPIEGIQQGPVEFGIGITEGTSSLLKNGVAGTFQSLNKMTGTISTGVSKMTMDKQYQEKRRRFMMKQPQNAIDGIEQAGISIFRGFQEGIVGIVEQPLEGAEKDGVTGFLLGTVKGLTGAIVKPITGILDATSKTAEGLSNTVTHFDDKANDERNRLPRTFYDFMGYYKRYCLSDAQFSLLCYNFPKLRDLHIIDSIKISGDNYLGIAREKIIIYNNKKLKIVRIIDPIMIGEIQTERNFLKRSDDQIQFQEDKVSTKMNKNEYLLHSQLTKEDIYKITVKYFYQSELSNIKQYATNQEQELDSDQIELFIQGEENSYQIVSKLKMVKHKDEIYNNKINFEGSDFGALSPKKQDSFQ